MSHVFGWLYIGFGWKEISFIDNHSTNLDFHDRLNKNEKIPSPPKKTNYHRFALQYLFLIIYGSSSNVCQAMQIESKSRLWGGWGKGKKCAEEHCTVNVNLVCMIAVQSHLFCLSWVTSSSPVEVKVCCYSTIYSKTVIETSTSVLILCRKGIIILKKMVNEWKTNRTFSY